MTNPHYPRAEHRHKGVCSGSRRDQFDSVNSPNCSEVETTIAASCILTITPSLIRGGDGCGFIEHVVTHANYQRRGVGQAIVKFALDYTGKMDVRK